MVAEVVFTEIVALFDEVVDDETFMMRCFLALSFVIVNEMVTSSPSSVSENAKA